MTQWKTRHVLVAVALCVACSAEDDTGRTDPTVVNHGDTTTERPVRATTGPGGISVLRGVDAGDVALGFTGNDLDASIASRIPEAACTTETPSSPAAT